MKTRELRERLLVAMALTAKSVGLGGYHEPLTSVEAFNLKPEPGQLRLLVKELENNGYFEMSYTLGGGEGGGMHAQITSRGLEAAEDLLEEHPAYAKPAEDGGIVPAAGRYVSLDDNQRGDLRADLAELNHRVAGINDVDEETKQIALSEIQAFEATIVQPRVSSDLIDRFANQILGWILRRLPDAVLAAVVSALVLKLLPFLA